MAVFLAVSLVSQSIIQARHKDKGTRGYHKPSKQVKKKVNAFTIISACADSHTPTNQVKKDRLCPGYYLHTSSDTGSQKHTRMHIRTHTFWVT